MCNYIYIYQSAEERGACVGSVQVFISEQGHALVDGELFYI